MRRTLLKPLFFLSALILLVPAGGADEKYIEYDFSDPQKVFGATLAESVTGAGVEPSALFRLLRAGQIVIINDRPRSRKIPWFTTAGVLVGAPAEHLFAVRSRTGGQDRGGRSESSVDRR